MSEKQSRSEVEIDGEYQEVVPCYSDDEMIQKDANTIEMVELGLQSFEV